MTAYGRGRRDQCRSRHDTGGTGEDTYHVDNAADIVKASSSQGALDSATTSVSYTLGSGVYVEKLRVDNTSAKTSLNLICNGIAQALIGKAGSNILNSKADNHMLNGGTGGDRFVFDTALNASTNVDIISDFSVPDDSIRLDNVISPRLVVL